jgi:hypothetical protein
MLYGIRTLAGDRKFKKRKMCGNYHCQRLKKEKKKGRLLTSHRYNRLPLLPSGPGGVQQELVV